MLSDLSWTLMRCCDAQACLPRSSSATLRGSGETARRAGFFRYPSRWHTPAISSRPLFLWYSLSAYYGSWLMRQASLLPEQVLGSFRSLSLSLPLSATKFRIVKVGTLYDPVHGEVTAGLKAEAQISCCRPSITSPWTGLYSTPCSTILSGWR